MLLTHIPLLSRPQPPLELDRLLPPLLGRALLPLLPHVPPTVHPPLPPLAPRLCPRRRLRLLLHPLRDDQLPHLDPRPEHARAAVAVRGSGDEGGCGLGCGDGGDDCDVRVLVAVDVWDAGVSL